MMTSATMYAAMMEKMSTGDMIRNYRLLNLETSLQLRVNQAKNVCNYGSKRLRHPLSSPQ